MPSRRLASLCILLSCVAAAASINCWQCGQYSDGVGSITPCNNRSAARLNQCPPDAKYCIKMPSRRLASLCILLSCVAAAASINCWQCGQYSDGVGSITPCNNRSAARLNQCPPDAKYCIKYVSELTVVRDCVPTCSEKEWWGARTFCCETDECNGAFTRSPEVAVIVGFASALVLSFWRS